MIIKDKYDLLRRADSLHACYEAQHWIDSMHWTMSAREIWRACANSGWHAWYLCAVQNARAVDMVIAVADWAPYERRFQRVAAEQFRHDLGVLHRYSWACMRDALGADALRDFWEAP